MWFYRNFKCNTEHRMKEYKSLSLSAISEDMIGYEISAQFCQGF